MKQDSVMHRLSEVVGEEGEVRRDAAFARTGFAGDGGGRVLCCAAAPRWLRRALAQPDTAAVVAPPDLAAEVPEGIGVLVAEDAEMAFWRLHNRLARASPAADSLEEAGLDSLDKASFFLEVETATGVKIPDAAYEEIDSIDGVIAAVKAG